MTSKNSRTLLIALGVIGVVLASTIAGTLAGGVAGYFAGRRPALSCGARHLEMLHELDRPLQSRPRTWILPERVPEWQPDLLAEDGGALITEVIEGTPADEADLRVGDIITLIDGEQVTAIGDLAALLGEYEAGDRVELTIQREDDAFGVDCTLGQHPDDEGRPYLGIYYRMVRFGRFGMPEGQD